MILHVFSLHVGLEELHFLFIKIQLPLVRPTHNSQTYHNLGTHLELELKEIRKIMQFPANGNPSRCSFSSTSFFLSALLMIDHITS